MWLLKLKHVIYQKIINDSKIDIEVVKTAGEEGAILLYFQHIIKLSN